MLKIVWWKSFLIMHYDKNNVDRKQKFTKWWVFAEINWYKITINSVVWKLSKHVGEQKYNVKTVFYIMLCYWRHIRLEIDIDFLLWQIAGLHGFINKTANL